MKKVSLAILNGKNVVVTGGAGFIGSHLVDDLVEAGCNVTVYDNLLAGNGHINVNAELIEGSVLDSAKMDRVFRGKDLIFHQAAIPSIVRSYKWPHKTMRVNEGGTYNVLRSANKRDVNKIVYASSSSVYGLKDGVRNELDSCSPLSPYAISKYAGELHCYAYEVLYGFNINKLRYFNVYGPRQYSDGSYPAAIPGFIGRIKKGLPPLIYGDGNQIRDYTYVKDVTYANLLAAVNIYNDGVQATYNIGGGNGTTLNDLLHIIARLMCEPALFIYMPERIGDVKYSVSNIELAGRYLGYQPQYTLEMGLKEMLKEYGYG